MAKYTDRFGLKLPDQTDFYNVDDFNENFRKIDQEMADGEDISNIIDLADPIRSNRAPTISDAHYAGKIWIVPKMIFNNLIPSVLNQSPSNWQCSNSTASASGQLVSIIGDGTASTIGAEITTQTADIDDLIYIHTILTAVNDANGVMIELLCGDDTIASDTINVPTAGDKITFTARAKVTNTQSLKIRVNATYNSSSQQFGKTITLDKMVLLNLTNDMCQNFSGIEFSEEDATTYVEGHDNFQTKTYEFSEYWWICRGSINNEYSWQRYDDYTNSALENYLANYQGNKASIAEAQAGEDNTKWMTPLTTKESVLSTIKPPRLLQKYNTAGTVNFRVPEKVTKILVIMIGGGGSGGVSGSRVGGSWRRNGFGFGGGSGVPKIFTMNVTPGQTISGVVGAGGPSVSCTFDNSSKNGNNGGTTSFGGKTCAGGKGGEGLDDVYTSDMNNNYSGADGGQPSLGGYTKKNYCPQGGNHLSEYSGDSTDPNRNTMALLTKLGLYPFAICAGFSAVSATNIGASASTTLVSGNKCSTGYAHSLYTSSISGIKGTDPGCGGSGVAIGWDYELYPSYNTRTVTSAAGCDGCIFIYDFSGKEDIA